ncbi:MAG: hypothetical protein ACR2PL_04470 [Dehalococcoidia bacterium]
MAERLHYLHPQTRQVLRLAQQLTDKAIRLREVDHLEGEVNALLRHPTRAGRPFEIVYRSGQDDVLDHLIAHEVGHVVRLYRVPEAERHLAMVQPAHRERAARQLLTEVPDALWQLSPTKLADLFIDWHQNVATQVANFPADLRIEQWIHDRYRGLRSVQERSLLREVARNEPLFHPLVRRLTPPTIYQATMAMNAAQAWHMSQLYVRPQLMDPFALNRFSDVGKVLAEMVFTASDDGHRSDMVASDIWAAALGLSGWFSWQSYRQMR